MVNHSAKQRARLVAYQVKSVTKRFKSLFTVLISGHRSNDELLDTFIEVDHEIRGLIETCRVIIEEIHLGMLACKENPSDDVKYPKGRE